MMARSWRSTVQRAVAILALSLSTALLSQIACADDTETQAFHDGHADRQAWEAWFTGLNGGPYRDGVEFWASHRSDPQPPSCASTMDIAFRAGCEEAKRRLDPTDQRRRADSDYKAGWNSPLDAAAEVPPTNSTSNAGAPSSTQPETGEGEQKAPSAEVPDKQTQPSEEASSSTQENPPISLHYKYIRAYGEYLCLTPHVDRITIKDIVVNRKQCVVVSNGSYGMSWSSDLSLPSTGTFGNDMCFEITPLDDQGKPEILVWQRCHVIEVVITTDNGTWKFTAE